MTDPMTPLTEESEALLFSASYTEGPGKEVLREALYRIEAAAARRAIEGSGVVEVGGASLIASERRRQVQVEGYTPEHDAGQARELTLAAISYLLSSVGMLAASGHYWPWSLEAYKPTGPERDRIRAGALVAAAIDAMHPAHRAALPRDPVQGSGAPTNLPAPADRGGPEEPRVEFTGQMDWPCVCGHAKAAHHFGDKPARDGSFGTWCQMDPDHCYRFTPEAR